jgi:chitinase
MIGVNDSGGETFTLDNANAVKDFATSNGVQELSYWALGRDKACATPGTLSDSCSGVDQSPYQFASIFLG